MQPVLGLPAGADFGLCERRGSLAAQMPGPGFCGQILPRHGQRPLGFIGRLLLEIEACAGCYTSSLSVFEIQGGGYAACIRHARQPDNAAPAEMPWRHSLAAADAAGLCRALRAHAPLALKLNGQVPASGPGSAWPALLQWLADDAA